MHFYPANYLMRLPSHSFSDDEVLAEDFMEKVLEVARVAQPLVEM
jgi:hypothetical protein